MIFAVITSLLIALTIICGYNLTIKNTAGLNQFSTYIFMAGHFFLIYSCLIMLKEKKCSISNFLKKNIDLDILEKFIFQKHTFLKCLALILIAWLPILLAFYPGIFSYDAPYQYSDYYFQVFDSGNPVIHTLIIGFLLNLGHNIFGNYNFGVLFYSIFQTLILSLTLSYVIFYLNKRNANKYLKVLTLLIFMFLPTHSLLAITTTKDVIFSCVVTIVFIKLIDMVCFPNEFFDKKLQLKNWIVFIIFSFLIFIFRLNGIYAYTLLSIFMLIILKKKRKILAIIFFIIYLLYAIYSVAMPKILNTGEKRIQLPPTCYITFQQMGRVYKYGDLSTAEKNKLNLLFNDDIKIKTLDNYAPHITDPILRKTNNKYYVKNQDNFWKQYFIYLKKYPFIYIDAFLDNTIGYWYFSDILPDSTYYTNYRPYLEMYTEDRDYHTNDEIKNDTKFEELYDLYKEYVEDGKYQKIPILSLLMNNAVYNILLIICALYMIIYKRFKVIVPISLLVGLIGTNFLGPVSLTRYCYYLYICSTLIIALTFQFKENSN